MKTSKHKKCKTKKKLIQYNNTKYKHNNSTYKIKRVHIGGSSISTRATTASALSKVKAREEQQQAETRQKAKITQIIAKITDHILSLIDNNKNYIGDNKTEKFNKTVNYLFDLFNLSEKISDSLIKKQDIGTNSNVFLINLISINYKAYIKNKKTLLEQQPQHLQFIDLHGVIVSLNTGDSMFFKLPSNINRSESFIFGISGTNCSISL